MSCEQGERVLKLYDMSYKDVLAKVSTIAFNCREALVSLDVEDQLVFKAFRLLSRTQTSNFEFEYLLMMSLCQGVDGMPGLPGTPGRNGARVRDITNFCDG